MWSSALQNFAHHFAKSGFYCIPETHKLVHFNVMFAHLFNVLSKSQGMSLYEIKLVKTPTIEALVNRSFSSHQGNVALPYIGPRTVAYIHALIVDSVTLLQGCSIRVSKRGRTSK